MGDKGKLLFGVLALACGSAAMADSLLVYSPQGEERGEWIVEQARLAGHDVEMLNAGGSELFQRLLAEKANPQADVVLGLVDSSMALLKKEGMFQKHVPAWNTGLPSAYSDPDGIVHKFWQTPIVLAYNADVMDPADAPRGWLDLTKPRYKGKYVIGSSGWQTTRIYIAGILVRFMDADGKVSDQGWDFIQQLYDNAGLLTESGDELTKEYANRKATVILNWFGGVGRLAENANFNAVIVDTAGGTPYIAEGIAIVKGTDKLAQAKLFVDWFGSPEFMSAYANKFKQLPAHPQALERLPKQLRSQAGLVHPQPIDWDLVAEKIEGWMQRIELEIK